MGKLEAKMAEVIGSELSTSDKIYWLLEDCKRYGTLPFAGLARAGFIAVQFLQSFIDLGIITKDESERYMASLDTVASQLSNDFASYARGSLSRAEILAKYGHLRPGTYDITSQRYDEAFDSYFDKKVALAGSERETFAFSQTQLRQIQEALSENGIEASAHELLTFMKEAIEGREYSKFVFTKSLSQALLLIEQLGQRFGLTRDDMSFVDISLIREMYSKLESSNIDSRLRESITRNKAEHRISQNIRLPQLITDPSQVYDFSLGEVEPNFITSRKVTSTVVEEGALFENVLTDKIVFIKSADPGYDWIFSHAIRGLVTMYGGANSHMAIRCAELQIPAVIGCGEVNYLKWSGSRHIEIDCTNRKVTLLQGDAQSVVESVLAGSSTSI